MKIKIDENLPTELLQTLGALGHSVDTAPQEGLRGRDDDDVWAAAVAAGRLLITQDLDFSDHRRFAPGTHPGIVLVRFKHPSRQQLLERITAVCRSEPIESWAGCIVVVGEVKVRVLRATGRPRA